MPHVEYMQLYSPYLKYSNHTRTFVQFSGILSLHGIHSAGLHPDSISLSTALFTISDMSNRISAIFSTSLFPPPCK